MIRSPQTVVHFVTLLEEMPVQETLDGIAELKELDGIRPGAIIVNMARPLALRREQLAAAAAGTLDVTELALGLKAAGLDDVAGLADALATETVRAGQDRARPGRAAGQAGRDRPAAVRAAVDQRRHRPRGPVPARRGATRAKGGVMGAGPEPPQLDVDRLIDDRRNRIIVCCGSGGVGKTTTAAAIGLRAAERGRRVVVLTVDPARRLAQSMGLSRARQHPAARARRGRDSPGGSLHAMMLDMKRTFDEIVEAHADPDRAAQILANPFYQSLSSSFAGTQEYMAMEKLGQLSRAQEWDLIVVDTPPTRSALDFLDAPQRLARFLDGRLLRLLVAPAKVGGRAYLKVLNAGFGMVTGVLTKILGAQVLQGRADLRVRAGHDVRRLPRAGRLHLSAAARTWHRVPRRRGAGAGRAAGGLLLCRAARRGAHAAGRAGPEPGAAAVGRAVVGGQEPGGRGDAGGSRRT